jgi:hypothetical protein
MCLPEPILSQHRNLPLLIRLPSSSSSFCSERFDALVDDRSLWDEAFTWRAPAEPGHLYFMTQLGQQCSPPWPEKLREEMERLLPQLPKQKLYDDVSSGLQYTAGGAVRAEVVGAAWQQQADVGGGDIVFGEPTFSFGSENFGCVVVYVAGCADSAACYCFMWLAVPTATSDASAATDSAACCVCCSCFFCFSACLFALFCLFG